MVSSRIKAVRKIISGKQCGYALVTDPVDAEYISGFRASNAVLLISRTRLELFTDFRYKEAAKDFCRKNGEWKFSLTEEGGFKYLKGKIKPGAAVGIQSDAVTIDGYRKLKRALPGVKLVPLSGDLGDVSVPKLDCEIRKMRAAARAGDRAFKAVLPLIKKSVTELELARAIEDLCAEHGSEKPAFDTIVLFGKRGALPHGRPGNRKLKAGDFVLMDFGCTVGGFCSDMTRTVVYGKASDKQRDIYNAVLRAQTFARSAARAGITGGELDSAARDAITERGYGKFFGHATGHGVGLRIHDRPRINKSNKAKLLENSVITIEPGIYINKLGGVRIEDMLVLKKNGSALLTHSPRKLIELPL
jgi:Xaa-Pro aminopeptidase